MSANRTTQFLRLEEPIAELAKMASVTCSIMEKVSSEVDSSKDWSAVSTYAAIQSIEAQFDDLMFCVYQVLVLSRALDRLYHSEPVSPA